MRPLWLCILLLLLAPPIGARAQLAPDLIVQLTDGAGLRLPDVQVQLFDRSGQQLLAQATTDAAGTARFERVPLDPVRVAVRGRTSDGTPLVQRGLDGDGLLVYLDVGSALVDLVVEPSGLVQLNPLTSITLEGSGAADQAALIPTAPLAPPPLAPVAPAAPAAHPPAPALPATARPPWWGLPALLLLAGGIALLIAQGRRTV